jgi:hypothetical protein
MNYVYAYFGTGTVILIAVLSSHFLHGKKESPSFKEAMEALHPERKTIKYKIVTNVIPSALAGVSFIVAWPIVAIMFLNKRFSKRVKPSSNGAPFQEKKFAVSRSSLVRPFTVEEIEEIEIVNDPLGAAPKEPFGHLNSRWRQFKQQLSPDSEVWAFNARWQPSRGSEEFRSGYAELRHDEVGAFFLKSIKTVDRP